jgi:hypothetical protein
MILPSNLVAGSTESFQALARRRAGGHLYVASVGGLDRSAVTFSSPEVWRDADFS